jgi:hypothetical protein
LDISENIIVQGATTLSDVSLANLDVSQNLIVQGATTLSDVSLSSLDVSQNLIVQGATTLSDVSLANLDISENLIVQGATTLSDVSLTNLNVSQNLIVQGATTLQDVSLSNLDVSQNLIVQGATTLSDVSLSNLDISENLIVQGATTLQDVSLSNLDVSQNFKVQGATTLSDVSLANLDISENLIVQGNTNLTDVSLTNLDVSQNLLVQGATTLQDVSLSNLDVSQNLIVQGKTNLTDVSLSNLDISQNLVVQGATTLQDVSLSNLDVSQNLIVEGKTTLQDVSLSSLDVSQNLLVQGNTNLTDVSLTNLEVSQNLIVQGKTNLSDVSLSNLDVSQNLIVQGETTLQEVSLSNLDVSQNLIVQGETILQDVSLSNLDISQNFRVLGKSQLTDLSLSNLEISGNLDLNCNNIIDISNLFFCDNSNYINTINQIDLSLTDHEPRIGSNEGNITSLSNSKFDNSGGVISGDVIIDGTLELSCNPIEDVSKISFCDSTILGSISGDTFDISSNNNIKITASDEVIITNDLSVNGTIYWNQFEPEIIASGGGGGGGGLIRENAKQASGTEVLFEGLPEEVRRITVIFEDISLNSTDNIVVQLGDEGGIEITNYTAYSSFQRAPSNDIRLVSSGSKDFDTGFGVFWGGDDMNKRTGSMTLSNIKDNIWVSSHTFGNEFIQSSQLYYGTATGAGRKELSSILTQIRVTPEGSSSFDGGTVNIMYEFAGAPMDGKFFAFVTDEKPQGTDGGTFVSDIWQTRDLNTEITDVDDIVELSGNQMVLQSGKYYIKWSAPAFNVAQHITRLRDVSNQITIQNGTSEYSFITPDLGGNVTRSIGSARVEISSETLFEIQHYGVLDVSDNGLGVANDVSGTPETYTAVELFRETVSSSVQIEGDLTLTGDISMNCGKIRDICGIEFCDGTILGNISGDTFDISSNNNIKITASDEVIITNDLSVNGTIYWNQFEPELIPDVSLQSAYDNSTDGTITLDGTKPFGINDASDNAVFKILNNNKVGIGTSTPEVGLEVVDSSSGQVFHVKNQKNFGVTGDVSNSFPIGRFTVNQITDNNASPSDLNRGLEIGAPSGGVTGPVYLKVTGTSNDFRILDNSNNQNLTIKSSGTRGGEPYFGFSEINPLRKYVLATDRPDGQSGTLLALYNRNFDNADIVLSFRTDISGNNSDGDPYKFAETGAISLETYNFDTSDASHSTDLRLFNYVDDELNKMIELNHNNYVNILSDLCMNDNLINDVSGINFSDGTFIGQGNSFDISTSEVLKVNQDALVVDTSNNIGIGTVQPSCSLDISRSDAIQLPSGTTNERPANAVGGMIRYNTLTGNLEFYNDISGNWISINPI